MLSKVTISVLFVHVVSFLSGQQFVNITDQLPLTSYKTGNSFGSGVSAEDFDNDGDVDVYILTGHGFENILLENNGSGTFTRAELGLGLTMQSRSAVWFDFNGDGLLDIFIAGDNYQVEEYNPADFWKLYIQQENGEFLDESEQAGLTALSSSIISGSVGGISLGDLNLDDHLDIVITYYIGNPYREEEKGERSGFNSVLINNGEGQFELRNDLFQYPEIVTLWQPVIYDIDQDGYPEVYIAQDHQGPNFLFKGKHGLFDFEDVAPELGMDHRQWDMGVTIGDFDNDNDFDVHVTNIRFGFDSNTGNYILQNQGEAGFEKIGKGTLSEGDWSWGATSQDFDNNGTFDLAVTNGYRTYLTDQSKYWSNLGNMNFEENSEEVGFMDRNVGSSLVSFDFDNDGDLDFIQTINSYFDTEIDLPIRFYRNDLIHNGSTNYLFVKPRMQGSNAMAIGAKVELRLGSEVMSRPITSITGYYGQEPSKAFFGLGESTMVDEVVITWPDGTSSSIQDVAANQTITITDEGVLHRPIGLTGSTDNTSISLNWNTSSAGVTGYRVERSEKQDLVDATVIATVSEPTYVDENLELHKDYFYRVYAERGEEVSDPSMGIIVISPDAPVSAPSNLIVVRDAPSLASLSWKDNADNEFSYKILRSLDSDFSNFFEISLAKNSTQYVDDSIEPGFDYYYKVRAERTGSVSEFSEVGRAAYVLSSAPINILKVYPSPNSGVIQIDFKDTEEHVFRLVDAAGRLVEKWMSSESHQKDLNVKPGVYFLKVSSDSSSTTSKIIVK